MLIAAARNHTTALVVVALAVLSSVLLDVPAAHGQVQQDFWKQTPERAQAAYRFLYSQSPQAIPTSYDPVREAEEILLRQPQQNLPTTNPESRSVWRQVRTVNTTSRLAPALRTLGPIGMAVGAFDLGWRIGYGINSKFLKLGIPANGQIPSTYGAPQLHFRAAGETSFAWYKVPVPEDAWVWSIWSPGFSRQRSAEYRPRVPDGECQWQVFTPPPSFIEISAPAGDAGCHWIEEAPDVDTLLSAYIPENSLDAPGPIVPYTGQTYDAVNEAPPAPLQPAVEQSIDTQLSAPENSSLRDWFNYRLGAPGAPDPVGVGSANPDIPFPGWFEHWQDHGEEFDPPFHDPHEYWRAAADIVERRRQGDPDVHECTRDEDGAQILWDSTQQAIVIVKDGVIVTFFVPTEGYDYWLGECG